MKNDLLRRSLRYALWALAAIMLLGVLVTGLTRTEWFQRALTRRVRTAIEQATGGRVEIGGLKFNLLLLRLSLARVVIHGAEPPVQSPLFSARGLVVRFSPMSFLRRRWILSHLGWTSAELHIRTNPDGSTNWPVPPRVRGGADRFGELMNWSVGSVTLEQTNIFWNNQPLASEVRASDIALLLRRDPDGEYRGTISSAQTSLSGKFGALPALRFSSRFQIGDKRLTVTECTWGVGDLQGSGTLSLKLFPSLQTHFALTAEGDLTGLTKALHLGWIKAGSGALEANGAYNSAGLKIQGEVHGRGLLIESRYFHSGIADFSSPFTVSGETAFFPAFHARALGGSLNGAAHLCLSTSRPQVRGQGRLEGASLEALLRASSVTRPVNNLLHPSATISGTADIDLENNPNRFEAKLALNAAPLSTPNAALPISGSARAKIVFDRGLRIEVGALELKSPFSQFAAQGTVAGESSNLNVTIQTGDLDEWRPVVQSVIELSQPIPLKLESAARFSGVLSGPLANPQIRGTIEAGEFVFRGWTWEGFKGFVSASPGTFELAGGKLVHQASIIRLDLSASLNDWRFLPESPVHVALGLQSTPIQGLEAALGVQRHLSGLLTGRLDLDGTAENLQGRGTLAARPLTIAGERFDSASAGLGISQSTWFIEDVQLSQGVGRATGQAVIEPLKHTFSGEIAGKSFSLSNLVKASAARRFSQSNAPNGSVDFDLSAKGWKDNLVLASQVKVHGVTMGSASLGNATFQMNWQAGHGRVQGSLTGEQGTVRFEGEAQTDNLWTGRLSGQFDALRLDSILQSVLPAKLGARVIASGSFEFSGPLAEPDRVTGRVNLQNFELGFPSAEWKNVQPIEGQYSGGLLRLSPMRLRGPATNFLVHGSIRWAWPPILDLDAEGEADATALSLFDPSIHATGRSRVKIHIGSSSNQPVLSGAMTVQDVSLQYGHLPFHVSGLHGSVQLQGQRAILNNLEGTSGGGNVTLSGFLTIGEPTRYDVVTNLQQVEVHYPADFSYILDGEMRLRGAGEQAQLSGEISLRSLLLSENFDPIAYLTSMGNAAAVSGAEVASPQAPHIALHLRITSPAPLSITANQARLSADVSLTVGGTLADPVALGTIDLRGGEAVFRNNRYQLTRGEITMNNPFRTVPELQLEAETRVDRYDLTLEISGPFDRLKFGYRSDPPLPTEDIVTLLALGVSREQQGVTQTNAHPSSSVGASTILSEALSSQVGARFQHLFGVSRIKVDPNVDLPGAGIGPRVTVEQRLSPDFTLTYSTTTSNSEYRVIQFEWALSDQASLIGIRDRNGVFGMELKFRHRFK